MSDMSDLVQLLRWWGEMEARQSEYAFVPRAGIVPSEGKREHKILCIDYPAPLNRLGQMIASLHPSERVAVRLVYVHGKPARWFRNPLRRAYRHLRAIYG